MTEEVDNVDDLPPSVRLDPRRGVYGGQFVLVTCPICGRKRRYYLSWYRGQLRRPEGAPRACSRECGRALRRIRSESGIAGRPRDYKQEPVTSHVIKDLPPWVRLDDTHRGVCGGRYVIVTCQVCGRERQMRISEYRSRERKGFLPRACSLKCAGSLRRIKSESGIDGSPHDPETAPVTDDPVIDDLPPWVRLDDTRRGVRGGRYVIVTCPVCGREKHMRISEFRSGQRKGLPPRACSWECAWVLRRGPAPTTEKVTKPRHPRRKNVPLAYDPKIRGVLDGTIRQTIRTGRRYMVGDKISFHGWKGRPYWSEWSFRTPYYELVEVILITLYPGGIEIGGNIKPWSQLDDLACLDGIDPPTGEALGEVLNAMYKIWDHGSIEAQILRW